MAPLAIVAQTSQCDAWPACESSRNCRYTMTSPTTSTIVTTTRPARGDDLSVTAGEQRRGVRHDAEDECDPELERGLTSDDLVGELGLSAGLPRLEM